MACFLLVEHGLAGHCTLHAYLPCAMGGSGLRRFGGAGYAARADERPFRPSARRLGQEKDYTGVEMRSHVARAACRPVDGPWLRRSACGSRRADAPALRAGASVARAPRRTLRDAAADAAACLEESRRASVG
jgi:hypothetical protein